MKVDYSSSVSLLPGDDLNKASNCSRASSTLMERMTNRGSLMTLPLSSSNYGCGTDLNLEIGNHEPSNAVDIPVGE